MHVEPGEQPVQLREQPPVRLEVRGRVVKFGPTVAAERDAIPRVGQVFGREPEVDRVAGDVVERSRLGRQQRIQAALCRDRAPATPAVSDRSFPGSRRSLRKAACRTHRDKSAAGFGRRIGCDQRTKARAQGRHEPRDVGDRQRYADHQVDASRRNGELRSRRRWETASTCRSKQCPRAKRIRLYCRARRARVNMQRTPALLSLRAQRSNLGRVRHYDRDCCVDTLLTMTGKTGCPPFTRLPC